MTTAREAGAAMAPDTRTEVQAVRRYFEGALAATFRWIDARGARWPLGARAGRRTTVVASMLERHGVRGKRVVDLGCGSGELSIAAARLGARVLGIDLVPQAIATATRDAAAAGVSQSVEFRLDDITTMEPEASDVVLVVGVIEYYSDFEWVLRRASGAVRDLAIIVDTRGPRWRRLLRRCVARLEHITLVYRSAAVVASAMRRCGFVEADRVQGHSFVAMAFRRERGDDDRRRS